MEKTQSLVLKSQPLTEGKRLVTLFTKDLGIISTILKGKSNQLLGDLLCEAEIIVAPTRSDLFFLQEGYLLDLHLQLRTHLSFLQTASYLVNAVIHTQMPGKPAPALFALLSLFLKKIPHFLPPETLLICFYLKLLQHEGLYHIQAPALQSLSPLQKEKIAQLASLRNFSQITEITESHKILEIIENWLFYSYKK